MDQKKQLQTAAEHQVREHIRLLRTASRSKLAVLTIGVLVTWGLWTVLQASQQKWFGVADKYETDLSALKKKYKIPENVDFDIDDPLAIGKVLMGKGSPFAGQRVTEEFKFLSDFSSLQTSYDNERNAAGNDQAGRRTDTKYERQLSQLKQKYGIPASIQLGVSDKSSDVLMKLTMDQKSPFAPKSGATVLAQFETDFSALQDRFETDRETVFLVPVHVPYLDDTVGVNGLTLADWWPFGLIAILAVTITLHLRQRVNAIAVSWLSTVPEEQSEQQSIIIRSDFRVGTLTESPLPGPRYLVYRSSLTLQPETLLLIALSAIVLYVSASFESFYNPALSHTMDSTLFDYFAGVWFFSVVLAVLVWLTHRRYANALERFIGCPVYGALGWARLFLRRAKIQLDRLHTHAWLDSEHLLKYSIIFTGALVLASLALPWMTPGDVRGYRFLYPASAPPISDPDIMSELQIQLGIAVAFPLCCLATSATALFTRSKLVELVFKVEPYFGVLVLVLAGNVIFHCGMLQLGANAFGLFGFATRIAAIQPLRPADLGPLVPYNPAFGLAIFSLLCLILTIFVFLEGDEHILGPGPESLLPSPDTRDFRQLAS